MTFGWVVFGVSSVIFRVERVEANLRIGGGGPWWGSYIFSMEPPSGVGYEDVLPLMLPLI
jgi:hypothetical protein